MSLLLRIVVNALALWLTAYLVPGIHLGESASASDLTSNSTVNQVLTIALVALIFGAVNALIKPILSFFSLPLVLLTLGLFTIIINALMFALTSWICGQVGLSFTIDHFFWDAVIAAIVLGIVSFVLGLLIKND